ncbi:neutral/alkaline non-lysosomal ceramidase N-terminal domain-containing protein [Candidatus Woesearchaeota archaeon]|nr:neutral/alkaline non-lysosomal ceramidase N-terminal domain-containing protein [Candidatus Woesearchaeota archaeon]
MKYLSRILFAGILAIIGCVSPYLKTTNSKQSFFSAGFAKQEFPVHIGKPLAGYRSRKENCTSVHDPVCARAMVISGKKNIGLVSCDLLLITNDLREKVLEKTKFLGLDDIVLGATHTHSSIGGYWDNSIGELAVMSKYSRHQEAEIVDTISSALKKASKCLQPAEIGAGQSSVDLTKNRHIENGEEAIDLGVIAFKDQTGKTIGYITTYGTHPTILGACNTEASADYPGALSKYLEIDGKINLFFSGALGDQEPERIKPNHKFERIDHFGRTLAYEVIEVEKKLEFSSDLTLSLTTNKTALPFYDFLLIPNVLFPLEIFCDVGIGLKYVPRETILQLVKFNNTYLAATPCDLGVNAGKKIKETFSENVFPLSHCNDYIGYVLTSKDYKHFGYANILSFYGENISDYFAEEFIGMNNNK